MLILPSGEHSNEPKDQEEPTGKRDQDSPVGRPNVVRADDSKTGDEHQHAREIHHGRDLAVVEVRLNQRKFRDEHGDESGAD